MSYVDDITNFEILPYLLHFSEVWKRMLIFLKIMLIIKYFSPFTFDFLMILPPDN